MTVPKDMKPLSAMMQNFCRHIRLQAQFPLIETWKRVLTLMIIRKHTARMSFRYKESAEEFPYACFYGDMRESPAKETIFN